MLRFRRRLFCWIALVAMLLGALAPTLSRALAQSADEGFWLEVCSASGTGVVAVSAAEAALYAGHGVMPAGDADGGDAAAAMDACPYCCSYPVAIDLPAAPVALFALPAGDRLLPERFLASPRPLFVWSAAQPRAPPRLG